LFCSPVEGSEYKVGQIVNLSWNPYNPNLAIETEVQVYLLRKQQNNTGIEEAVLLSPKNSTDYILVPIEENSIDFTVETGWFPNYNNSIPSEDVRYTFIFRVIPRGHYEKLNDFNSVDFIVIEPKPILKSESVTSVLVQTIQATPTNVISTPSIDSGNQKKTNLKIMYLMCL